MRRPKQPRLDKASKLPKKTLVLQSTFMEHSRRLLAAFVCKYSSHKMITMIYMYVQYPRHPFVSSTSTVTRFFRLFLGVAAQSRKSVVRFSGVFGMTKSEARINVDRERHNPKKLSTEREISTGQERTQGHPTRNFDEISVRESLLVLRLSDNALTKSD